jgi:Ig-like domain-containing protein
LIGLVAQISLAEGECTLINGLFGSYHLPNQGSGDYYYEAGHGAFGEARNFFIFPLPAFPGPLRAAEVRLRTGFVTPTNGAVAFEFHHVEADPIVLLNNFGFYTEIFNDLGDGPVLGSRTILGSEGRRPIPEDEGALITIPLNAAGLNELTARQNNLVVLGGAVPLSAAPALVFERANYAYPQLVLYFSNASPPQITIVAPTAPGEALAGDRVTLAAMVCGKTPLVRQWFKDNVRIPNATGETLEISSMTEADAGTYQLVAANELDIAGSDPIQVQFAPLRILSEAQTYEIFEGSTMTLFFSVYSRLPVTYQWRKDGVNLIGETSSLLQTPGINPNDAGMYDVIVSNSAGSRTSAVITVTVVLRPPILVNHNPETRQIAVGMRLDLYNQAFGSEPIQYQWYRDGDIVPGATSNFFHIASVGFNDAGAYRVVAANGAGSATSVVYQVTVHPLVVSDLYGFGVSWLNPLDYYGYTASSVPWTVQWYFNDAPIPNGTNEFLRFEAFDYANEGQYFFVARNIYGAATSTVATLTVVTNPPSVNAWILESKVWVGENVDLFGYGNGGPPPTFQWLFNGAPLGSPFQAPAAHLPLRNVTTNDSGIYELVASNVFGVVTSSPPAALTVVAEAPFFINLPARTNELDGNIVSLRAKAVGGPPPVYQWRKNGVDLPGETNTSLLIGAVHVGDGDVYEIVARNELGEGRYTHRLRVTPATGLDRWNWRLPKAQGSRLYQIAAGNGGYVAAGKSGNIISSGDGMNWTSTTIEADTDLSALAAGNGVFVAAGMFYTPLVRTNLDKLSDGDGGRNLNEYSGLVLVSSNGTTWSVANNPESDFLSYITFGNGVFVASGYYSPRFCYTSTDGRNWTPQGPSGVRAYRLAFGNGRFVAWGYDGAVRYSLDGANWTRSAGTSAYLIGFANGRFLSFLDYVGLLYESVDGLNWQALGPRLPLFPEPGIAGSGGVYIGRGEVPAGQVLRSTDAINWLPVDTGTRQEIEAIIYDNGHFIGVGEAGTVTRSIDGLTWTPDEVANKIDFYGITHGAGLHVVAGDAGTILTSSNALDWVRRNTPITRNLHAVAYGDGLFVAGGRGGALITSPDGITWTVRTSGMTNYIERITRANNLWVAVAETGGITTSSNGLDWNGLNTGTPFTDHEGIAFGNGIWVSAGGYFLNPERESQAVGTIYTSVNGSNWTRRGANYGKRFRDVTFGKGKFVAIGNDGLMAFSTNGIQWLGGLYIEGQNLRRIHYANSRFLAVGNDGTLISSADPANGLPWTKHRSRNSQNLHDIHAAPDGRFVFVGNNGMVLQSGDTQPKFLSVGRDGRLEFDRGIVESLRLERSTDLRTWETEAVNVTSPFNAEVTGGHRFWRLAGD